MNKSTVGISTYAALEKLYQSIKAELNIFKSPRSFSAGLDSWIRDAYQCNSPYSPFCWTSALIVFIEILGLTIFHRHESESFRPKSMVVEILFLFLLLVINICLIGCDSWLRHTEMYAKAQTVLEIIDDCKKQAPWNVGLYSHLHTPQSPCISSQWTYRNGELVNLPNHLLVEGDIILLRPGHVAPGRCKSIDKQFETPVILNGGKVFAPVNEHLNEGFSVPQIRKPAKPAEFTMLETPYVKNFKLALKNSLNRPVTLFNKESHTVLFHYVERIVIPIVMAVTAFVGILHSAYFSPETSGWIRHLILRPLFSILPLLPLVLPVYWIILNAYGNARLLAIVEITKQEAKPLNIFEEMEEFIPPAAMTCISFRELKPYFLALLLQRRGYLWRSANLLHVLGSITALCCVDKKGILSWPNPTAEKVFFLKPLKSKSNSQDSSHLEASCDNLEENSGDCQDRKPDSIELKKLAKISKRTDVKDHMYHPNSQVEVLDLTHNTNSPFGIQFDDPNWKSYIGNLKPLGLAILLNTCNPKAQEHYTQFSDHIACESLYNCAAVPVVNKRCLCELAKQIGFTNSVVDFYDLEQQLGVFRHVHPEVIQKGRLARSLNFPRLKMPFPNISCAIVKDLHRGSHQLFSQGTANLVLDACNEYWDGEDISMLMESDRKRILDFYHRSSLTAHCMGYAYGPMSMSLSGTVPDAYVELPADGGHLHKSGSTVPNSARAWDNQHTDKGGKHVIRNRCLSSDSLILSEPLENGAATSNATKYCVEQIGNEIFIGMVTMQYQACPDFVQLIEQLDKACIRFVHFSKENELRSRVFSEKMGLESGWNCHISLLSEDPRQDATGSAQVEDSVMCPRKLSAFQCGGQQSGNLNRNSGVPPRSISAPSMVNLDTTVVKFEDEISMHSRSEFCNSPPNVFAHREKLGSNLSVSYTDASSPHIHDSVSSIHDVLFNDEYRPSYSPSHITESTEQSAPVTFDMSNRAKLPKGTENIRPHIENIDNVPLQVSLFTDCTPEATREMICIMQEYGEVVCCLGSAANCQNMPIFLQADVSIAVEPLYPQLCVQQPVFDIPSYEQYEAIGPTDLSHVLNSLPCSLSFHRENPISLYHLIMEARHFMSNMRSSFQFMLSCCLSLSLLQILAAVFFLPAPLSLGQLLWLNCLVIPLLSLSLMGNPTDSEVTFVATGKNLRGVSKQVVFFFAVCYCAKFCPSVIAAIFCFACIVASTCDQHSSSDVPVSESCWIFTKIGKQGRDFVNRESWSVGLIVGQNVVSFFMLLYFVLISSGFVYRSRLLWNGNPLANRYWAFTASLVICMQAMFITADISIHASEASESLLFLNSIPFYVWLIGLLWPVCLVPLNELVKRHEIKMNVRQQKRARLEFCTKLGMNSPF